jgi:hypothetical protein
LRAASIGRILLLYAGSNSQESAMKTVAVVLALLVSPLTLAAQNAIRNDQPVVVFNGNTVGSNCPIGMHASQGVWDHTIRVRQGQQERTRQPFGQRILLSLVVTGPSPIVSATVKVRGLTGKNRMLQTESAGNVSGDGVKIMKITFVQKPDGVSSDLYVPGFTSVSSIELLEVSYGDGKVWKIAGAGVCRVTPDPMMLIANH